MNEVAEKQKAKIMEHLDAMSAKQLRILAQQQEILIPSSMRKDEIKDEIFEVLHKRGVDALDSNTKFPEDDDIMNHIADALCLPVEKAGAEEEAEAEEDVFVDGLSETPEPVNKENQGDEQLPAEPMEEKTEPSADEKAAHIVEWERKRDSLREAVAEAAVKMTEAKADAKAATKIFDTLTEQLIDHLNTSPQPTLFDNVKKCRVCGETESLDVRFATDDLCQSCADKLGKETQQDKQAREVMALCPECMGTGFDKKNDRPCEACNGMGKVQQSADNEVDPEDLDGIDQGDGTEEVEPVESEEEEPATV